MEFNQTSPSESKVIFTFPVIFGFVLKTPKEEFESKSLGPGPQIGPGVGSKMGVLILS